MILNTYLFFLVVIITIFTIAYLKKSRETVLRVLSFFGILNVFSLAYIIGVPAIFVLVTIILAFSIYELSKNYDIRNPAAFALIITGTYLLLLYFRSYLIYTLPAFFLVVGLTFAGTFNMVKGHLFVYLFGVMFLAVSAASLVLLYPENPDAIVFLISLLAFNDVTGYFAGRKFGKIKIFKTLSPKKTLEGYVGGLVGLVVGLILFHTIIPVLTGTTLLQNLILLVTFFIFGNAGDLLFSKIKRSVEVKDFGSILPGHGGVLDRFDSALMVSPLLYVFLYLK